MQTVLISGASVAGLALAHWLSERGFAPTVVERAHAVRPGGQAVDVRGVALDVLDRMDLLHLARRARTRMRGMSMHDGDGNELWRSTTMTYSGGRLDGDDIELLREDLTALLYDRVRDRAAFRFRDALTALHERPDGVDATFESGARDTFDYVVGADGLHSRVRQLAFGPEAEYVHHLGSYLSVFSTENFARLDDWQVWLQGENSSYCLYPVRDNTELRATLGFMASALEGYDHRDTEGHRDLLDTHLAGLGGHTPKLLEAARTAPDFYFDAMAQVRMDRWTRGRTALVGDAGYCPSPLSGQGTSLALAGAYVLAEELGRAGDPSAAFGRYDARMRPFVTLNQALATDSPGQAAAEEAVDRAKNALSLDA